MGPGEHVHRHASPTGDDAPRIDGPADAPLLVVHADLSCPDCAVVMARLGPIPLRIDLRHFVLRSRGVPARRAAIAAEAAALQDAFWPFARALLARQGRQELPDLWALADELGLDVDRFEGDRRAGAGADRIARDTRAALDAGATGVPALFGTDAVAEHLAEHGYVGPAIVTTADG
ncbi:MAG: DsbA family protein [Patulibacter minatonensis]